MKTNWFLFKINWLLMLFIFVCKVNQAQVPEESFSKSLKGNQVHVDSLLDVKDDKFGNAGPWSTITDNYYSEGVLIFEINPDTAFFIPDSFSCTIDVVDTIFDASNTKTTVMESLTVDYNIVENKPYKNRAVIFYHSAHRIRTKILGIHFSQGNGNAVPPNIFRLRSEIHLSRSYQFDCNAETNDHSIYYYADYDRFKIAWYNIPGATDYDLEWTFYDDSSTVVKNIAHLNFDSLFTHNATRITTKDLSYYISPIFQSGYLFYRIRGVKTLPNFERMTAIWSTDNGIYQHIDWHHQTMNWQYNVSFAEGGKKKEVVNYMDGSLRNRQSVTRANTLDTSIVGETIYDYQGRPAVTVLPAPTFDGKIRYFNRFNINPSGQEFNWSNFDVGTCGIIADTM